MNLLRWEADALCRHLVAALPLSAEVAVFPSFPLLPAVVEALAGSGIGVGGQDLHPEPEERPHRRRLRAAARRRRLLVGALRPQRAPPRPRGERRARRGEGAGGGAGGTQTPGSLCVGETRDERRRGETFSVLDRRSPRSPASRSRISRAWCSPTSRCGRSAPAKPPRRRSPSRPTPTSGARLATLWGAAGAARRILYGGSVTPDNSTGLAAMPDIDGGLVGGASFDAGKFLAIISSFAA